MWAASTFFGVKLPYWEIWIPLAVGMVAGGLSIVAVRSLSRRRGALPPLPLPKQTAAPDPFVHGSATEQRRSLRRGGNPVPVLIKLNNTKEDPWHGWVYDRSMGGLGLIVDTELQPGELLRVIPHNAPQSTPWSDIEVRSCRHVD